MSKNDGVIFISYAHARRPLIKEAVALVSEKGFNIWFDRDIQENALWSGEILEKIEAAKFFVLILDRFSNDSRHVLAEVQHAFSNHIPMLIIQLEQAEPSVALRYFIGAIQYAPAEAYAESISAAILRFLGEWHQKHENVSLFSMLFLHPVVFWIYGKRWVAILTTGLIILLWSVALGSLPKDSSSVLLGGVIMSIPFWAGLITWARAIVNQIDSRKIGYQHAKTIKKMNYAAPWVAAGLMIVLLAVVIKYPPKEKEKASGSAGSNGQLVSYSFAVEAGSDRVAIGDPLPRELMRAADLNKHSDGTAIASIDNRNASLGFFIRDGKVRVLAAAYQEDSLPPWKMLILKENSFERLDLQLLVTSEPVSRWKRIKFIDKTITEDDISIDVLRLSPSEATEKSDLVLMGTAHLYDAKSRVILREVQIISIARSLLDAGGVGELIGYVAAKSLLNN